MRTDELAYQTAVAGERQASADHDAACPVLRDPLTGLASSILLNDRLTQALGCAAHRGELLALLCLGIDNLPQVRDGLGQEAAARLLADSARRLQACVKGHDTVARLGDHEFAVVLGAADNADDVGLLCEELCAAMAPGVAWQGGQVHGHLSIGIALFPQDGPDAATLLRHAGEARAGARARHGGKYQFYSASLNQRSRARTDMEVALRLAIARDELQLQYQPLADLQSGAIAGMEALLRWQPPTGALADAGHFLPLAEDIDLIAAIGNWVLRRACRDLRDWRAAGRADVRIAINVAPSQFHQRRYVDDVAAILAEFDVAPAALTLEITEVALMLDSTASADSLTRLKALGLQLALDDFGTGQSSLNNLTRYPFDQVKIDREVVRGIVDDSGAAALSKTIISMAHNLGIRVVAEGVETEGQCDFLRRNMCDLVQGYFFAPPLALDGMALLLDEPRRLPPHLLRVKRQPRSLLLVDDEHNIVSALKRLLRADGYQIFTAHSGQEGLDLLERHPVDVIVSDQRMPGMIGADFLRKAKQLYPATIRIMLSGYTELQSVTDAVNEGAIYKFLTKPWEDALLRGHIAEAFRLKEIADENERLNLEVRTANHELAAANRRMEELLLQKQQQISRDEISLSVAHEVLQRLPLPVIGLDDQGMIAFINGAAERLFPRGASLLGNEVSMVLPALFSAGAGAQALHRADIGGARFDVAVYPMGERSAARGSLMTLSRSEAAP
ncbi:EAL domain-containing protein [Rugamonas sp.]|uniref:EAL domain-containing protein n=1 Tax=Rugamonas sp. TaxID=1926287 RepID=UPI0025F54AC4|nr:EAL domain-containing protein [Rugamonas sp.]